VNFVADVRYKFFLCDYNAQKNRNPIIIHQIPVVD